MRHLSHSLITMLCLCCFVLAVARPAAARTNRQWVEAGNRSLAAGKAGEAVRCYRAALKLKKDPAVLFNLGNALYRLGRKTEARKAYESVIKSKPSLLPALRNLIALLVEEGHYDRALPMVRRLRKAAPRDERVALLLGVILQHSGKAEAAATIYRKIIKRAPQLVAPRINLAQIHIDRQEFAQGAALLEEALILDPSQLNLLGSLGSLNLCRGDWHEATVALEMAQRLGPPVDRRMHLSLGDLYLRQRMGSAAVEQYRKALVLWQGDAETLRNLGMALFLAGRYAEALEAFAASLEMDDTQAQAWVMIGRIHLLRARLALAVLAFERASALAPESTAAHLGRGQALLQGGQTEEAVISLRRAVSHEPRSLDALRSLAHAYATLKRGALAADCYARVLEIAPADSIASGALKAIVLESPK